MNFNLFVFYIFIILKHGNSHAKNHLLVTLELKNHKQKSRTKICSYHEVSVQSNVEQTESLGKNVTFQKIPHSCNFQMFNHPQLFYIHMNAVQIVWPICGEGSFKCLSLGICWCQWVVHGMCTLAHLLWCLVDFYVNKETW